MNMKTITTHLVFSRACKHSKVFEPCQEQKVAETKGDEPKSLTAIYICNEALEFLDNPQSVKITIESEDS